MKVYVVTVNGKISSEGYAELEDAQAFIERRSDKPEKITPMKYQAADNEYLIMDVDIAQPRRYGDYAVTAKSAKTGKVFAECVYAGTPAEARRDFREIYRHGNYRILGVAFVG